MPRVFEVTYTRERGTDRWKARTTEKPDMRAVKAEGFIAGVLARWEGQTAADENHATIYVSVEGTGAEAIEKANRIADGEFRKRHPKAEIAHAG